MTSPTDPSSGSDPGNAGSTPSGGWGPPPGWAEAPGSGSAEAPPQGYAAPPPGYSQPGYGQPPPGWGQPGYPAQYGGPPRSSDDTTWAVLAHLSFFVLALIGPLAIYLVKKDSSPFLRQHAAEALNFHITFLIAMIVSFLLVFVIIGFFLVFAVIIVGIVFAIIAAVAAGKGEPYRYPMTIHFVS